MVNELTLPDGGEGVIELATTEIADWAAAAATSSTASTRPRRSSARCSQRRVIGNLRLRRPMVQGPLPADTPVKVAVAGGVAPVWVTVQVASTPLEPAAPVPSATAATV